MLNSYKFTKSRSRKTNDNALAECKNGAVIRKILGYAHIPQKYATEVNEFNRKYLTPYLNFHRPCFFAETVVDKKGKERKKYRYENMMTPYEKFKSLPNSHEREMPLTPKHENGYRVRNSGIFIVKYDDTVKNSNHCEQLFEERNNHS